MVGYFDDVANDGRCGAGMVLLVNDSLSFRLLMNVGSGTNTKSELLALWGLLFFAFHKNYCDLHVRGDSLVTIDWDLGNHSIRSLDLETLAFTGERSHWTFQLTDFSACVQRVQHIGG